MATIRAPSRELVAAPLLETGRGKALGTTRTENRATTQTDAPSLRMRGWDFYHIWMTDCSDFDFFTMLNLIYRALCARKIAARTTIAPKSCTPRKDSPNQAQATITPATGSSIATIPALVAGM